MNVQFRPAQASDQEAACPLIYSSAPEIFDYLFALKKPALDFLQFGFIEGSGLFGYQNHIVAIIENTVAGIGAFYSGKEYFSLGLGNTKQIFKFFGPIKGMSVFKKCLQVQKLIPPPDKMTEYVADLGVTESFRGQGIGTALLKHQMEIAQSKKRRFYALDVAVNNPRAQKLYEKLGLKVIKERTFSGTSRDKPIPNAKRMILAL